MQLWDDLLRASAPTSGRKPIMVENCHWGSRVPYKPNATWCPWNFYRTSGDVRATYPSIVGNLQTTIQYAQQNLSRPGCWAYPDMLEVGVLKTPFSADRGLTEAETRAHFGSWVIVSSPLTLSHDVNNVTVMDAIWPVISNPEVIAVSQSWAGHSGSPFKSANRSLRLAHTNPAAASKDMTVEELAAVGPLDVPEWQYFYKPMAAAGAKTAVLMMNHATAATDLTLTFADVPGVTCSRCSVRDIWARKDIGTFAGTFTAKNVTSHDAAFLVITPT